jgi:hypothetical protein
VWLEGDCGSGRGKLEISRDIHNKLTEQKGKQNSTEEKQNKTETEQK